MNFGVFRSNPEKAGTVFEMNEDAAAGSTPWGSSKKRFGRSVGREAGSQCFALPSLSAGRSLCPMTAW